MKAIGHNFINNLTIAQRFRKSWSATLDSGPNKPSKNPGFGDATSLFSLLSVEKLEFITSLPKDDELKKLKVLCP